MRILSHQPAHELVDLEDPGVSLARVDVAAAEHDEVEVVRVRKVAGAVGGLVEGELRVGRHGADRALVRRTNRR